MLKNISYAFLCFGLVACNFNTKQTEIKQTYSDVKNVGAMKNVMWKGELGANIKLDTISNKKGLYGLGPITALRGEILINNGVGYISKVISDSTMVVKQTFDTGAPFFVYANVTDWQNFKLDTSVKSIKDLEQFIDKKTTDYKRPFVFKLTGRVLDADIHIQNLPEGTKVSSPEEAHTGQTNYNIKQTEVTIIGFFSTKHKGVFTHHDSNVHMHLITKDGNKMGHLDRVVIDDMTLFLPKK